MVSQTVPTFNHLNLRNAVVPLIMPLAAWDTNIGTRGVSCPKSHVASHFDCVDLMNAKEPLIRHFDCVDLMNAKEPLIRLSESCDGSVYGVT